MAEVIEKSFSAEVSEEFLTIAEWERREGKLEKALETARLMKEYGDPFEKIRKITGLTETQLKEHGVVE